MPSLRPVNFVLLPVKVVDLSSFVSVLSPTVTPSSVLPSSSAVSTNVALPADSGISSAPSAFLSIVMVETSSATVIVFPSSDLITSPVVTADTSVTTPFFTVKSNTDTTVNPSGATVSSREYLPSLRYSRVEILPTIFAVLSVFVRASPPLIFTPSSVPSLAVSSYSTSPASSGIAFPPRSVLLRLITGASLTVIVLPSSDISVTPSVTALTSVTSPFLTVNVNSETVE